MDSLYLLIPVAMLFCVLAIALLLWAIDSGQYEDLDNEAWRILDDPATDHKPGNGLIGDDHDADST